MFAGTFAPVGWAFCDGSLLSIAENDVLFNLIGTTYGGDGQQTFALPDLRGRVPIHMGRSPSGTQRVIGETGGTETVTLTAAQAAGHYHPMPAASSGTSTDPQGNVVAGCTALGQFSQGPADAVMHGAVVGQAGGNQPHENMMPYLAVSFIISLFGIYPSQ